MYDHCTIINRQPGYITFAEVTIRRHLDQNIQQMVTGPDTIIRTVDLDKTSVIKRKFLRRYNMGTNQITNYMHPRIRNPHGV